MARYTAVTVNHSIELLANTSSTVVFRIPYRNLMAREIGFSVANRFIVYILFGRNAQGKDMIYVGKSKNGLDNRPTAHNDKFDDWTTCYVLTQSTDYSYLNDGVIQHIEHKLNERINICGLYVNTTETTASGTANKAEEEDSETFIQEAIDMLYVLGLDLALPIGADSVPGSPKTTCVPDGTYSFRRKNKATGRTITATMQVAGDTFTVLAGSMMAAQKSPTLSPSVRKARSSATVENGILMQPASFGSPSSAATFVSGEACDGWVCWKTPDGKFIDVYRKKN